MNGATRCHTLKGAMRSTLAYTAARLLLFVVVLVLLRLAGIGGLLLFAFALLISGLLSFVLLSRQRDAMSGALVSGMRGIRERAAGFRERIEEGARAEDED